MRTVAAALLLAVLAPLAWAQGDGLDELDKEVLVELIRRQQRVIEQLEERIAELEQIPAEELPESNDDQPDRASRRFNSVGAMLRGFPRELLPNDDGVWRTRIDDANEWLQEHSEGALLSTRRRNGHGWVVSSISREDEDGVRTCTVAPAYPVMLRGRAQVHRQSLVRIGRNHDVEFRGVQFQVSDPDEIRQLERYQDDRISFSIEGEVKACRIYGLNIHDRSGTVVGVSYYIQVILEGVPNREEIGPQPRLERHDTEPWRVP